MSHPGRFIRTPVTIELDSGWVQSWSGGSEEGENLCWDSKPGLSSP
jgi:hypothetical protein